MRFSTADLTLLRIRCPACRQHTEQLVTLLLRKDTLKCSNCGEFINLRTPQNTLLIGQTAEACARIGAALIASIGDTAPPEPPPGDRAPMRPLAPAVGRLP